mmetsp:Transcript_20257/g.33307  ORF Transcript_20257/g.33307 Transcript_20257/m.33307 type:complete len:250 (+) Transcript_20257:299-1048(+)
MPPSDVHFTLHLPPSVLPTSTRGVFSRLKQLKFLCKLKESSYPFSTKLLSRRMCMTTASQNKDDCRVRVEATRRGGKMLTLIRGLEKVSVTEAKILLKKLKATCGVGGKLITSSSGGGACTATLELQGDHADALVHVLRKEGFTDVAKSGASGNSKPQLKWNSPKKVKEEHAKIKEQQKARKLAARAFKRAESRTSEAIEESKRLQMQKTKAKIEAQLALIEDRSSEEARKLQAKYERVCQNLDQPLQN